MRSQSFISLRIEGEWSYYIAMDKETLLNVLFKSDINSEQKFNDISQLTPAGRRVIILVINLALGGKPKDTLLLIMKEINHCGF